MIHGDDQEREKLKHTNFIETERLKSRINSLYKEIESKNDEIDNFKVINNSLTEENENLKQMIANFYLANISSATIDIDANVSTKCDNNNLILKEKIKSLEEEIEIYKMILESKITPKILPDNEILSHNDKNNNIEQRQLAKSNNDIEEQLKMEDLPVQGPIPKEPDEKLYFFPRRKSRIWSFFPRLTRALMK